MFHQDNWTVGRDVINAERLKLALSGNAHVVVHAAKVEMPSRFSSPRRTQQEELIHRHQLFGGRDDELARLDALVSDSPNQFHFVHAASGFGKTALLANWVVRLRQQQQPTCWQFINRFDGMADEEFTLRNACEQLVALHGIVDELPVSIADLRNCYVSLLKLPYQGGRLIVVLDGLDEAKGWSPGPSLFPRALPPQTHVVFSARAETDDEASSWLTQIGLDHDQVDILRLNPLAEPAVAMLLQAAGGQAAPLAKKSEFVRSLTDVSKGDPFYLHFLVQDITAGAITPDTIGKQPRKLKNYLDQWKNQLFEDVDVAKTEAYPILGLLCAALGPLKPAELLGASPALKDSLVLERELTGPMRRYLSGSRDIGYALGHPRFRDYLAQNVFSAADLIEFRRQLLEYCRGWRRHHGDYALNHLAGHLADQDLHHELSELVSKEWKVARAAQTGSPRGLVSDLDLAIGEEITSSVPASVPLIRCALAYSTVISIVEWVPDDLFGALTRLGRDREAMDYVSLLRSADRKAAAYGVIAAAFSRRGMPEDATGALALSLASAERISDPSVRVSTVLRHVDLLHELGDQRVVERADAVLEAAAMDLEDAAELDHVAGFFETIRRLDVAEDMRERSKTARDLAGSGFKMDLSWLPAFAVPAEEPARTADSLLAEGRVDEAMNVLLEDKDRLESARTLAACGEQRRAMEIIEGLRLSTDNFRSVTNKVWLSELAVLLAECQSADAARQCKQVLDSSISYVLPSTHLVRYCELLVQLEERPKAVDLTRALVAAVSSMDPEDWNFGRALTVVAHAACSVGDDLSLRRLKELALRPLAPATQLTCRAALASAFAQRHSIGEARSLLAPVLEAMLSFGPDDYKAKDHVGPVASAFAHLKDVDSLRRLCHWALSGNKYQQPPRLEAVIPALARLGDKATIEAALTTFLWDRWSQRSRVLAAGSAALLHLGDTEAAGVRAREAVDAFLKNQDGAVTPDVLPHLIPVVVATGYKEGLVQISQMSADKWPYRREWGPGVRLLLPALAALGLDDVQPRPYKVFLSETSFVDEAKVDLAQVYAERGLVDRAITTADEARSPAARARAHVRIASVMANAGDVSRARERLLAALSRFPAIRGDAVLVADMAILATRIGANPSVFWTLKQTFLRATDIDVVSIDVETYRNAARAAARLEDDGLLRRATAVAAVARSPVTRAAAGAAVMLALAEAGRHEDSNKLKDIVHRDVQDVGDVTQRASPLLDMAQASALSGRVEDARGFVAQALDCTRHSGRQRFLEAVSAAASIVVRDDSAVDIGRAIVDVDSFWN